MHNVWHIHKRHIHCKTCQIFKIFFIILLWLKWEDPSKRKSSSLVYNITSFSSFFTVQDKSEHSSESNHWTIYIHVPVLQISSNTISSDKQVWFIGTSRQEKKSSIQLLVDFFITCPCNQPGLLVNPFSSDKPFQAWMAATYMLTFKWFFLKDTRVKRTLTEQI